MTWRAPALIQYHTTFLWVFDPPPNTNSDRTDLLLQPPGRQNQEEPEKTKKEGPITPFTRVHPLRACVAGQLRPGLLAAPDECENGA